MTYEEYLAAQAALTAYAASYLFVIVQPFQAIPLSTAQWNGMLAAMYPVVEDLRFQSAELARQFYDSEREKNYPQEQRADIWLAHYEPDWFQEAMRDTKSEMSAINSTYDDIAKTISLAVKEIENGGRRTIQQATKRDKKLKGWARVQGNEDSCAFCLMMISRGPKYKSAAGAGLDVDEQTAFAIWKKVDEASTPDELAAAEEAMDKLMNKWHENCDCKVVPVFKKTTWPGREAWKEAERIWKTATRGYRGLDALNALRRYLYAEQQGTDERQVA